MTNNDTYKLKEAFNRIKEDILYLNDRIKKLEDENNYLKKKVLKNEVTKNTGNYYIGNLRTKKLHSKYCSLIKNITAENKINFSKINDAIAENYTKCSCLKKNN